MTDILAGFVPPILGAKKTKAQAAAPQSPRAKAKAAGATQAADPLSHYSPHRRVSYVGTQQCPCCGHSVEYIAGDLLEYWQFDRVAGLRTIRTRAFTARDYRWPGLPRELEYLTPEAVTCVSCLRTDGILSATLLPELPSNVDTAIQIPLF